MLHAHLPQSLGRSVVQKLETDGGFKLVKLGMGRESQWSDCDDIRLELVLVVHPEGGAVKMWHPVEGLSETLFLLRWCLTSPGRILM